MWRLLNWHKQTHRFKADVFPSFSLHMHTLSSQTDSNVLTQLVRAGDFKTFESHLQNLKEFYSCCSTSDATNMYLVLSSLENVLLSINKVR